MKEKQGIIKAVVVLVVICIVTSAALAIVNSFTAPVSKANAEARETTARQELVPDAVSFEQVTNELPDAVLSAYEGKAADGSAAGVLLLVNAEHYPDITARVSPSGVLTLQKPTTPQMILQSLQLLCGTRERLRKMEQKTASIEEKMAEIRLVNRAKWLLIDRQGLSEQEAHRFIEKQAMDRCVSRRVIAQQIIDRCQPAE